MLRCQISRRKVLSLFAPTHSSWNPDPNLYLRPFVKPSKIENDAESRPTSALARAERPTSALARAERVGLLEAGLIEDDEANRTLLPRRVSSFSPLAQLPTRGMREAAPAGAAPAARSGKTERLQRSLAGLTRKNTTLVRQVREVSLRRIVTALRCTVAARLRVAVSSWSHSVTADGRASLMGLKEKHRAEILLVAQEREASHRATCEAAAVRITMEANSQRLTAELEQLKAEKRRWSDERRLMAQEVCKAEQEIQARQCRLEVFACCLPLGSSS